jgi:hypothetical protein
VLTDGVSMMQGELLAELVRFRESIEVLSKDLPRDEDFWPAYAERANALQARCPLDLKDYARESILRTVRAVSYVRTPATS